MLLKLNDSIISNKKLVAYFLAAPRNNKSYSFKNRFKYKVRHDNLYIKAKSDKLMLYKENGVKVDYKKTRDTELRFREFTIELSTNEDEKKSNIVSRLFRSISSSNIHGFSKVENFDTMSEFNTGTYDTKFNKTKFHYI